MKFDYSHVEDVERSIQPHFKAAITLPVLDAFGKDSGIAVYVTTSLLAPVGVPSSHLIDVAKRLQLT